MIDLHVGLISSNIHEIIDIEEGIKLISSSEWRISEFHINLKVSLILLNHDILSNDIMRSIYILDLAEVL